MDRACRADPEFPPGVQLLGIDARGGGRLMAVFAGPGVQAECAYTEVAADGSVTGSLSSGGTADLAPMRPGQVENDGFGGFNTKAGAVGIQYVMSRLGAGVERVVLQVADIGPVTATLGNGWYLAWWETGTPPDPNGPGPHVPSRRYTVTAYDALGQVTDQKTQP